MSELKQAMFVGAMVTGPIWFGFGAWVGWLVTR